MQKIFGKHPNLLEDLESGRKRTVEFMGSLVDIVENDQSGNEEPRQKKTLEQNQGSPVAKSVEQRLKTLGAGGTLDQMNTAAKQLSDVLQGIDNLAARQALIASNQTVLEETLTPAPDGSGWTRTVNTPNNGPTYTVQIFNSGMVTVVQQ